MLQLIVVIFMCSMTFVMGATPPIGLKCGAFVAYDPLSGVLGCGSSSGEESEDVLKKQAVQNALDDCGSSQCKVYYGICLPVTARANLAWYVAASQSDPSVYAIVDASLRQPQHGRNEAMKKCSSLASDCKPVICKRDSRRTIQTNTPKNVCSAIAYDYDAGSIGICDQCNSTKDGAQTNAVGQCKHSVYGCSIKLSFCSKPGKMVGVLASNGPGEDSVYATSMSTNVTEAILNAIAKCNAKSELNDCDVETIVGDNQDRRRRQSTQPLIDFIPPPPSHDVSIVCSAIAYGHGGLGICDQCAFSKPNAQYEAESQCNGNCTKKLSFCSKHGELYGALASNGDHIYGFAIAKHSQRAIRLALERCNAKTHLKNCGIDVVVGDGINHRRRQSDNTTTTKCSAITFGSTTNYFGICDRCASSAENASQVSSKQCSSKGCGEGQNTLMTCGGVLYIGFASNGKGKGILKGSLAYGHTKSEAATNALDTCNEARYTEDGKLIAKAGGCHVVKVVG